MLNNKKKTITKSNLVKLLQNTNILVATTYDLVSDGDKKELLKDIESKSRRGTISVVLIEHR